MDYENIKEDLVGYVLNEMEEFCYWKARNPL